MGLVRFLAIFFLVYLIVRLFRSVFNKPRQNQSAKRADSFQDSSKKEKIIPKDEGEYVDFEELD